MGTISATPNVVNELMEAHDERELWIVSKEMERPPYWFAEEGLNARLIKALRVVQENRITPNSDGSFSIKGSTGKDYRITETCSCPQGQSRKSKYCLHYVAMCLYIEWQRRLGYTPQGLPRAEAQIAPASSPATLHAEAEDAPSPIDDETLPLPLPPASVDERLAQMPRETPQDALQQENAPMPESQYIPEPDAPVAVLERPTAMARREPPPTDLEAALTTWTAERAIVQRFLKQELKAGIDFYTLQFGGRESKPSLSKAGAEKVTGWLKLQASFAPDTGTWDMLGRPQDLVCYVCTLRTRSGEIVGEGRGARSIKTDKGDVNKAIKMAEKSAFVSAVLRTGALSDVFTQDLEDLKDDREEPAPTPPARTPSADLRQQIWAHIKQQAPDVTGREEAARWVKERTGYALVESNFAAILHALVAG